MNTLSIVRTVTAGSMAELRARRDEPSRADVVELRLDGVSDIDVEAALTGRRTAVIVTCRPRWEGGRFDGSEEERRRILERAVTLGAEYVDVEWRADFYDLVRATGRTATGVILSVHDFVGVPLDVASLYAAMRASGVAIVKIAVTARRLTDCLALADLGCAASGERAALIAMGSPGMPTRVLPSRFGSCLAYAGAAAPGQIEVDPLIDVYRVRQHSSATAIYGLLGSPIAHSISPAMHNAFFATAALDAVYVPLEAESMDDFLAFAADTRISLRGASVTAPFKVRAAGVVTALDDAAVRAGAVNTIRHEAEGWTGSNTDVPALLATLAEGADLGHARVAILGAGGAARAAALAFRARGARTTVYARRPVGDSFFDTVSTPVRNGLPPRGSWDVLVNATPVGTWPAISGTPIPASLVAGGFVYDLVYNPLVTRLQREAGAAGCRVMGGLDMLVGQAELQAESWTGIKPPPGVMKRAALASLEASHTETHPEGICL
jgi:3-dehydroquinate dehydratase/shikimate dehydrogenase